MDDEKRALCERLVMIHETIAPAERAMRRTDALALAAGAATVVALIFAAATASGAWVGVFTGMAVGIGFSGGRMFETVRARRRAFRAIADAHEAASLELAVHADEADE
jgi:hypothetical protein